MKDWAGSTRSNTSSTFYWSAKAADMLVLNSQPAYIAHSIKWLDGIGDSYDYVQMDAITKLVFLHIGIHHGCFFEQYDAYFYLRMPLSFNNGGTDYLLNILSPSVQSYVQGGEKC